MAIGAYSQLLTGIIFSKNDILSLFADASVEGFVNSNNAFVNDRNSLSDLFFKKMNISNFHLSYTLDLRKNLIADNWNYDLIGNRIEWQIGGSIAHFSSGSIYKDVLYNPGYMTTSYYSTTPINLYWK